MLKMKKKKVFYKSILYSHQHFPLDMCTDICQNYPGISVKLLKYESYIILRIVNYTLHLALVLPSCLF